MESKTPDRSIAVEFRDKPLGHHSPELEKVLIKFRTADVAGKYVLVCTKPYEEWKLGQLGSERGEPVMVHDEVVFHSQADGEWEVFKRRWKFYFNENLDDL